MLQFIGSALGGQTGLALLQDQNYFWIETGCYKYTLDLNIFKMPRNIKINQ